MKEYPLAIFDDRHLPENYSGKVYLWDIDKTYLSTRFSSLKGLARIPVEFSIDKRAIPGMPELLRGLRRGPGSKVACVPLYFISASPPFMHYVLENKMLRDGVEQDGIIFKDWVGTLLDLKPGRLWEQLGFKVIALLTARQSRPRAVEYLFGDDTEMDPLAFSVYSKIISGQLKGGELENVLREGGVPSEDRDLVRRLVERLGTVPGKVGKIFIHLESGTDPLEVQAIHSDLVPVKGAFQMSLVLQDLGLVDQKTVEAVKEGISRAKNYIYSDFAALREDAKKRKILASQKQKTKKSTIKKRPTASKTKK